MRMALFLSSSAAIAYFLQQQRAVMGQAAAHSQLALLVLLQLLCSC
jgi:hypothetical protein